MNPTRLVTLADLRLHKVELVNFYKIRYGIHSYLTCALNVFSRKICSLAGK